MPPWSLRGPPWSPWTASKTPSDLFLPLPTSFLMPKDRFRAHFRPLQTSKSMLPCRRELDSRKSNDSATELDFLTQNAPKRRPKAPQDAPRAPQELPESSPSAPQRVPGSSLEHSWRSRIAPKSSTSLNMTLLGLKRRPPEASGPSFGAFWRPRGLILEPPRPVSIDFKILFVVLKVLR